MSHRADRPNRNMAGDRGQVESHVTWMGETSRNRDWLSRPAVSPRATPDWLLRSMDLWIVWIGGKLLIIFLGDGPIRANLSDIFNVVGMIAWLLTLLLVARWFWRGTR
jgi:hypothetical protein